MNSLAPILQRNNDVELVAKTVAQDLLPTELNQFIHMCRQWRLDPLRRQIYAMVFMRNRKQKDDNGRIKKGNDGRDLWEKVRNVTYVTGIDGYRTIADRTGCYRPGFREVVREESAKSKTTNPQGIVSATAHVWKFSQGEWHQFSETVDWEEYAPLKEKWTNGQPTGEYELDTSGQWGRMGVTMLKKCAEAQALRRGWPDDLAGLYVAEEMDQARVEDMIDITPYEQAQEAERDRLQEKLGGPSLTVDWCDGDPLQPVPVGQFHDGVKAFIRKYCEDDPNRIKTFADRNLHAVREYYTHDKDGAIAVKKALEVYQNVQEVSS